jgi:hypothetical protein
MNTRIRTLVHIIGRKKIVEYPQVLSFSIKENLCAYLKLSFVHGKAGARKVIWMTIPFLTTCGQSCQAFMDADYL